MEGNQLTKLLLPFEQVQDNVTGVLYVCHMLIALQIRLDAFRELSLAFRTCCLYTQCHAMCDKLAGLTQCLMLSACDMSRVQFLYCNGILYWPARSYTMYIYVACSCSDCLKDATFPDSHPR